MLGFDRNPGPLNFIITGPFVDKFEKKNSVNLKDIYDQETQVRPRIRGGQHLQTGNCERDSWNMNRASERGTKRGKLSQGSAYRSSVSFLLVSMCTTAFDLILIFCSNSQSFLVLQSCLKVTLVRGKGLHLNKYIR